MFGVGCSDDALFAQLSNAQLIEAGARRLSEVAALWPDVAAAPYALEHLLRGNTNTVATLVAEPGVQGALTDMIEKHAHTLLSLSPGEEWKKSPDKINEACKRMQAVTQRMVALGGAPGRREQLHAAGAAILQKYSTDEQLLDPVRLSVVAVLLGECRTLHAYASCLVPHLYAAVHVPETTARALSLLRILCGTTCFELHTALQDGVPQLLTASSSAAGAGAGGHAPERRITTPRALVEWLTGSPYQSVVEWLSAPDTATCHKQARLFAAHAAQVYPGGAACPLNDVVTTLADKCTGASCSCSAHR